MCFSNQTAVGTKTSTTLIFGLFPDGSFFFPGSVIGADSTRDLIWRSMAAVLGVEWGAMRRMGVKKGVSLARGDADMVTCPEH